MPRDRGGVIALRIFDSLKPVIGAINGAAVGVGASLTLPMDVRLSSTYGKFGFVYVRRGIVAEGASSWFLPRIVGIGTAMEWVATGKLVVADEARRAGLVRSVHTPGALLPAARSIAQEIVEHTAPVSVALSRRLLWQVAGEPHPMAAHRSDSRAIAAAARLRRRGRGRRVVLGEARSRVPRPGVGRSPRRVRRPGAPDVQLNTAFVNAAGLRLRVGRHGDGPPLLLITGIGANLDMWAPLERAAARPRADRVRRAGRRRLAAAAAPARDAGPRADRRGADGRAARSSARTCSATRWAGHSRRSSRPVAPARAAAGAVRDRARAWAACRRRPMAALMLATPARYYHPRLLELSVPFIAGGRTARDRSVLAANAGARLSHPPDLLGYAFQLYALAGWTSVPWLRRLQQPTLVVAGDEDPSCRCSTPGCSWPGCPPPGCTSCAAAGTCSCSTSPRTRRRRSPRSSTPD